LTPLWYAGRNAGIFPGMSSLAIFHWVIAGIAIALLLWAWRWGDA